MQDNFLIEKLVLLKKFIAAQLWLPPALTQAWSMDLDKLTKRAKYQPASMQEAQKLIDEKWQDSEMAFFLTGIVQDIENDRGIGKSISGEHSPNITPSCTPTPIDLKFAKSWH